MIKNVLFIILLFSTSLQAAPFQTDTSAYQTQRLKVNALLNQRSAKFGQYDQSLDTKTGIFGFQTKGDIKNSNEILRQIVLNDNNIFKELKILMDYKDEEVKRIRNEANSTGSRINNYKESIKKLQDQNVQLKKTMLLQIKKNKLPIT
ncbi:hypothetical protein [Pedobacter steynii]